MTALTLNRGATVINTAQHAGLERIAESVERASSLLARVVAWVDAFQAESAAAHNATIAAALAASDHRVLAELRAAYTRNEQRG
jgi:hypothetical protein